MDSLNVNQPYYVGWETAKRAVRKVAKQLSYLCWSSEKRIFAIPRGGYHALYLLRRLSNLPLQIVFRLDQADVVIDDVCCTGSTLQELPFNGLKVVLFARQHSKQFCNFYGVLLKTQKYIVLPWEAKNEWHKLVQQGCYRNQR